MEAINTSTAEPPKQTRTAFSVVLETMSQLSDEVCSILAKICEGTCEIGRFVFKCLFLLSCMLAIVDWRHGPSEEPRVLMVLCCLGILAANLSEVALGKQKFACTVKLPGTLALLIYFLPIQAISASIRAF